MKNENAKKTALYRAIVGLETFILVFLLSNDLGFSITFFIIEEIVKFTTYYIYEKLWKKHVRRTK